MAEERKEIVSTTFPHENLWTKWTEEEKEARLQEIIALAESWSPSTDKTDAYRSELASGYGGFELRDDAITSKLRGALGEIISVSEPNKSTLLYSTNFQRFTDQFDVF